MQTNTIAAVPSPVAGSHTQLNLRVTARTRLGESLRVSGQSRTLGSFNPATAMELVTTPSEYPVWRTPEPIVVPSDVLQTYRYAVFAGGQFIGWEKRTEPRSVSVRGRAVDIDDTAVLPSPEELRQSQSALHE